MIKKNCTLLLSLAMLFSFVSCSSNNEGNSPLESPASGLINTMTDEEKESIVIGEVSSEQKYYSEVSDVAEYIQEMKIYDCELKSNYIVHITLPPDYDETKSYPMFLMTDGVWRLSDHAELRPMMTNGEIEDIILVSIGLDYDVDAEDVQVRWRELITSNDAFLDFITNNLAPYLGELYSIDYSRSALTGHSLGGLFTHYAAFNSDKYENQPFYYYLSSSPALWISTAYNYSLDYESEYFDRNALLDKQIYVTAGSAEEKEILTYTQEFIDRAADYNITEIEYEIYPDLDHIQIFKPTLRKTLLKFFGK